MTAAQKLYYEDPFLEKAWERRWQAVVYLEIGFMFAAAYLLTPHIASM